MIAPCPFCGARHPVITRSISDVWGHAVRCIGCGAAGPRSVDTPNRDGSYPPAEIEASSDRAIELWNGRRG